MGSVDTALDLEFLDLVNEGKGKEILIWITLQGVLGNLRPSFTDHICGEDGSIAATLGAWQPDAR